MALKEDGVEIQERDNTRVVSGTITVADAKVVVQVIDRLLSTGKIGGPEVLPIAIVRQKFFDLTRRETGGTESAT